MESGLIDNQFTTLATPHLTQEEAVSLVRQDLEARAFKYDLVKGFWPVFQGLREIRSGDIRPVWSVAFVTAARQVPFRGKIVEVPEEDFFGCVDDETKELLYIIYSTGYMEPVVSNSQPV